MADAENATQLVMGLAWVMLFTVKNAKKEATWFWKAPALTATAQRITAILPDSESTASTRVQKNAQLVTKMAIVSSARTNSSPDQTQNAQQRGSAAQRTAPLVNGLKMTLFNAANVVSGSSLINQELGSMILVLRSVQLEVLKMVGFVIIALKDA